ncbi:sulfatase-like hydrolase/transferase, partial [bacterium]|nr:sulfatase-like hydrolase/transferase [bacterium]
MFFKKHKRKLSLLILLLLCLEFSACSSSRPIELPELPAFKNVNIIIISLDTLRKDRLGAYGHPGSISPFIDRFTCSSVVFEDVASQSASTWTSHRSLFVSKYISRHTEGDPVSGSTLADRFRLAGYRTAAFVDGGKMHRRYGHSVGFDMYDDQGGHLKKIVPKAQQWILNHSSEPFFLFLHTYDIHAPYNPEDRDDQVFLGNYTVPDSYRTEAPIYLNTLNLNSFELSRISLLYNGGVRSCDRQLAEFFRF